MPANIRLANEAWESLMRAHATVLRGLSADPVWREHRLSMREYDVLYTLSKCADAARLGDLQQGVLLSQPALSRLVDRLVSSGLVERVPDPEDGRAVRVSLTERGREVQRSVGRSHARSVAHAASSALTDDELAQLRRLTTKLADGA